MSYETMTVKKLIEHLEQFNPDLPVYFNHVTDRYDVYEKLYPHLIRRGLIYPDDEKTDAVIIDPF